MSAGTDLSFVVNVGQAVDLYDLSGEGSKFFITVNGKYQGATEFSCNMWPSTYNKYKIETIKRETEELGDNSFSYMKTDMVKDVSFDMSYVTGTVNACTKFYVNQGDRNVSCLPGVASGSHTLEDMIFYNLYDMSGGWYSKVKVNKEILGLRLPTNFANTSFNSKTIQNSVKLSQDKMSVIWDNNGITSSSAPNVTFAVMIDKVYTGDFQEVVSLHQAYMCKIGVIIGQNIDKGDFEGETGTASNTTHNLDNADRSGWSDSVVEQYNTASDPRDTDAAIKYLYFQAGNSGYGTDIFNPSSNYASTSSHNQSVDNNTRWLGTLGYFGYENHKTYLRIRRVGNTIRINQSKTSLMDGYKSDSAEYIANVSHFNADDKVCIMLNQYLYTWNAPITQFLKLETIPNNFVISYNLASDSPQYSSRSLTSADLKDISFNLNGNYGIYFNNTYDVSFVPNDFSGAIALTNKTFFTVHMKNGATDVSANFFHKDITVTEFGTMKNSVTEFVPGGTDCSYDVVDSTGAILTGSGLTNTTKTIRIRQTSDGVPFPGSAGQYTLKQIDIWNGRGTDSAGNGITLTRSVKSDMGSFLWLRFDYTNVNSDRVWFQKMGIYSSRAQAEGDDNATDSTNNILWDGVAEVDKGFWIHESSSTADLSQFNECIKVNMWSLTGYQNYFFKQSTASGRQYYTFRMNNEHIINGKYIRIGQMGYVTDTNDRMFWQYSKDGVTWFDLYLKWTDAGGVKYTDTDYFLSATTSGASNDRRYPIVEAFEFVTSR